MIDSEVNQLDKGHSKQMPPLKRKGDTTTEIKVIASLHYSWNDDVFKYIAALCRRLKNLELEREDLGMI